MPEPTRLAGIGVVPRDPVAAAAEVHRAVGLGLPGVLIRPNHFGGDYFDAASWTPFYEALETTGGVLAVHEALGVRSGTTIGSDRFTGFAARHACSHPLEQMTAMVALVLGGVLERHPGLRVAFLESGTGWLPYWLARRFTSAGDWDIADVINLMRTWVMLPVALLGCSLAVALKPCQEYSGLKVFGR